MAEPRASIALGLPAAARSPAWPSRFKPFVRSALLAGAALLLLGWLLRDAPLHPLLQRLAALPRTDWIATVAALFICYLVRAWRLRAEWRQRLPADRPGVGSLHECLCMVLTHNAAVLLMPLRSGEAGYLWLLHRRWRIGMADAARSLMWLRLQDAAVLALLALLLLPPWAPAARVLLVACAIVLLGTGMAMLKGRRDAADGSGRLQAALGALQRLLRSRSNDAAGWCCSGLNWVVKIGIAALLFQALAGIAPASALRAATGGELGGAMPLQGPAGLGTYEAAAWAAVQLGWPAHAAPGEGPGAGSASAAPGAAADAPALGAVVLAALTVHGVFLAIALSAAAVAAVAMPSLRGRWPDSYHMKDVS